MKHVDALCIAKPCFIRTDSSRCAYWLVIEAIALAQLLESLGAP